MREIQLTPETAFTRYDEAPDAEFYVQPRMVTHIDDGAISAVTQLYRELFPPGATVLDLMSSWVSHLPPEVAYREVVGLGMNAEELAANPRLDRWVVHDLNREPRLPFEDGTFDGAAICVSIQYLTQPTAVLQDVGRVLKVAAPLAITFSNRCFPTKAVMIWQSLNDDGHVALVQKYFQWGRNWGDIEAQDRSPGNGDPLFAVIGRSLGPIAQTESAP